MSKKFPTDDVWAHSDGGDRGGGMRARACSVNVMVYCLTAITDESASCCCCCCFFFFFFFFGGGVSCFCCAVVFFCRCEYCVGMSEVRIYIYIFIKHTHTHTHTHNCDNNEWFQLLVCNIGARFACGDIMLCTSGMKNDSERLRTKLWRTLGAFESFLADRSLTDILR